MQTGALCGVLIAVLAVDAAADKRPGPEADVRTAEAHYLKAIQKINAEAAQARRQEFEKLGDAYRQILESQRRQQLPASRESAEGAGQPALDQSVLTDEWAVWSLLRGIPQQDLFTRCVTGLLVCAGAISTVGLAIIAAARRRVIKCTPDFCHGTVKVRLGTGRIDRKVPQQLVPTRWGSLRLSLREPWLVRVSFNIFSKKSGRYILCCHWGLRQWDLIGVHGAQLQIHESRKHET